MQGCIFDLLDKGFKTRNMRRVRSGCSSIFGARLTLGRTRRAHAAIVDNFPCQGVVLTQTEKKTALFWLKSLFFGYTSQLIDHCLGKDYIQEHRPTVWREALFSEKQLTFLAEAVVAHQCQLKVACHHHEIIRFYLTFYDLFYQFDLENYLCVILPTWNARILNLNNR